MINDGDGKDIPNNSDGNKGGNNQSNHMNRVFQVNASGILKLMATLRARSSLGGNIRPTAWTFSKCHNLMRRLCGTKLWARAAQILNLPFHGEECRLRLFILRLKLLYALLKFRNLITEFRLGFWCVVHSLILYYATKPPNEKS